MKLIWDTETFPNAHVQVYYNVDLDKFFFFEISQRKNDLEALVNFYKENNIYIGYNSIGYDHPLTLAIISNRQSDPRKIKEYSDNIITRNINTYPNNHIDLYRIHHFDNKNKATSLKWLECVMRWPNIQDLPYPPDYKLSSSMLDEVIEYCKNDVMATYEFFKHSKEKIKFHIKASKTYGTYVNDNEVSIGETINRKRYEAKAKIPNYVTNRDSIELKEVIPQKFIEYITTYDLPICKELVTDLQQVTLINNDTSFVESSTNKEFSRHILIGKKVYKMASGGIHSEDEPFYEVADGDNNIILDRDVGSQYPNTIKLFKYYPEHLGEIWSNNISDTINERITHKKKGKDSNLTEAERNNHLLEADMLKLALNGGAYGKLNSVYSWQYDPKAMLQVTITCQLFMLALIEDATRNDIKVISANTDGLTVATTAKKKELYDIICSQWENATGFKLEDTYYEFYYCRDINNYTVRTIDGKIKEKGCYEVDKKTGNQPAWHKDHSYRVVRLALRNKIHYNIPIEETIKNHKDIYDFCICSRAKKQNKKGEASFYYKYFDKDTLELKEVFLGKTIRFYPSNQGGSIVKRFDDGSETTVWKDSLHTPFLQYEEKDNYDINYNFFINLANRDLPIKI